MNSETILNYITGNCKPDEAKNIRNWIESDSENKREYIRLKNLYTLSSEATSGKEIEKEYQTLKQKLGFKKSGVLHLFREVLKYAAIVIFTFSATYFLVNIETDKASKSEEIVWNEIVVPKGQMSEFVFGDGTHVWLNSGSTLRVPVNSQANIREVHLEGEAFFDVVKKPDLPFVVHTRSLDVKVLGTSFNIQAYPDALNLETTLVEGRVEILNKNQVKLAELNKGELLSFSKSEKIGKIEFVDTTPYYAWRDGKMVFKDKPLGDIAKQLERWYNVKINFNDESLKSFRFSGTILKNKPFDQVLQAIKLTAPIRYEIEVIPDGSNEITLYSSKK
jgi:transmembrane sensor